MYPIVLNGIKQHEIINGYNNCGKNDKTCCGLHKISPYKYIVLSIQKEVNLRLFCSTWWTDSEPIILGLFDKKEMEK
jgi:hypothetical protein